MAKPKKTTPRLRRSVPLPPRQGRPGAMSPTLWADAYREAEAGGQLRFLETEPRPAAGPLAPEGCRADASTRLNAARVGSPGGGVPRLSGRARRKYRAPPVSPCVMNWEPLR